MPDTEVERIAVAFARILRGAGLDVPVGRAVTFAEALTLTGVDRSGAVYWAGRTTLLARPEDIPVYDRAFSAFWRGQTSLTLDTADPVELTIVLDDEDEPPPGEGDEPTATEGPTLVVRWSRQEVLRQKDFAAYTSAEFEEARRLMADLRLHGALRRSRRRRPSRKAEGRPDLRRTVRRALRCGGEPIRRAFPVPGQRPRRIVLICDVSGSMEPYSRALVRFLHAAVVGRARSSGQPDRGLRPRHPADPDHPGAVVPRPRRRPGQGGPCGARLVGRDPPGRGPPGVQRPLGRARHGPPGGGRDPVRRLGPG